MSTKTPAETNPGERTTRLPFMKTFEDAAALFEKESDPFYLAAFMIQCWLGGLALQAATEYAEKKSPKDRSIQTGQAWRAFLEIFPSAELKGFRYLLSCLFRFSACDASPVNPLRQALVPLSIEHHCTGEFFGPKTLQRFRDPEPQAAPSTPNSQLTSSSALSTPNSQLTSSSAPSTPNSQLTSSSALSTPNSQLASSSALCTPNSELHGLSRLTVARWCDWLDATVHLQTHRRWHSAPACFDPDPEKRELASLGNAQRQLARLSDHARICWLLDFTAAIERYKDSPKWATVGKAISDDSARSWTYAEVDTRVISLWPLVTRYNWTYRDLLNTIRPGLKRPEAYPCECEQDFVTYCANVLGLRKTGRGRSAKNERPAGYEIAQRLFLRIQQKETRLTKGI